MRIVITGATGNVGTSVLRALADQPEVHRVIALSRRAPARPFAKTEHFIADVAAADLHQLFEGADCVVHLAWQIQPSHRQGDLLRTNVLGSQRVFEAVAGAGVPALVYASSVGAYNAAPNRRPVDESWPIGGIPSSPYARQKAEVERLLDAFEHQHPDKRVVRMRPALIFKREAASEIARYFGGPLLRGPMLDPRILRVIPAPRDLAFQCVHSLDVGQAYAQAIVRDVHGAFNLAADPILTGERIAKALSRKPLVMSRRFVRRVTDLTWRLRLQPSDVGWVDMAFDAPIIDATRAREALGWDPRHDAVETLLELLDGIREGDGMETPPLTPRSRVRRKESATRATYETF